MIRIWQDEQFQLTNSMSKLCITSCFIGVLIGLWPSLLPIHMLSDDGIWIVSALACAVAFLIYAYGTKLVRAGPEI
ncbi:hypothetical protein LTR17_002425 [Elasticomyces elasticus]|nr:hypothetical protein LTR17_002425 [Elasticomyces elasticus]